MSESKIISSSLVGVSSSSGMSLVLPLGWSSDWDGEDIGYPDISVVGYYCYDTDEISINAYIDMDTGNVLELWSTPLENEENYACY